ncbi:winged helix-turn-helix transcriptional regulator [Streptomyces globisporus]|uniref:winged helix-turn-helix transcriptional regulator n=1 Tax=Streptomyces globisporus TaxID=1908 RepID=UPI00365B6BDC
MATTGLTGSTKTDLARVTETLEMIAPRWSAWVLMTLKAQPLRYTEVKQALPWLHDGQLHPRLSKLCDSGLVERNRYSSQHVTYGLTSRGTALIPVLRALRVWGDTYLEPGAFDPDGFTAHQQQVEDALVLLTPRHTTAILWALRVRDTASAKAVAAEAMPDYPLSAVYPPLDRLAADGLIEKEENTFTLSASGSGLAPVYTQLSAWAAGRPIAEARHHPVWAPAPGPAQYEGSSFATTRPEPATARRPAPSAPAARAQPVTWRSGEMFSDRIPARPVPTAAGPRR